MDKPQREPLGDRQAGEESPVAPVDLTVQVGVTLDRVDFSPDIEEAAAKLFLEMPPAPPTVVEIWKHLMTRSLVNKIAILRVQDSLAVLRQAASKTEARVAHTERQLEGVQHQLHELRDGQQALLEMMKASENTRQVELRFQSQTTQQMEATYDALHKRLAEDAKLRQMQNELLRTWHRPRWLVGVGLILLAVAVFMYNPVVLG